MNSNHPAAIVLATMQNEHKPIEWLEWVCDMQHLMLESDYMAGMESDLKSTRLVQMQQLKDFFIALAED